MAYLVVKIVHITMAMLWFAFPLGMVRLLKASLVAGEEAFKLAASEARRRGVMAALFGGLTLVSGLGLIFIKGGMGSVSPSFHAALTIAVVMLCLAHFLLKPLGARLERLAAESPLPRDECTQAIKKLAAFTGVLHLMWLLMLVLMYLRF